MQLFNVAIMEMPYGSAKDDKGRLKAAPVTFIESDVKIGYILIATSYCGPTVVNESSLCLLRGKITLICNRNFLN